MKSWANSLLEEYKAGRKQLRKKVAALNDEIEADKVDKKIINSMIYDMDFVIEWLETGMLPEKNPLYKISKYRAHTYADKFVYGMNGYWDESIGGFVSMNHYNDPYKEVEDKIDHELEVKRREAS